MSSEGIDPEAFRIWASQCFGLQFGDDKIDFLRDVLRQRMAEAKYDSSRDYTDFAASQNEELGRLAEALTVTETFFFRNYDHYRALIEIALPARIRAKATSKQLRILSAGCASGEEAYTLAMIIKDHFPELQAWELSIVGVDINPAMLVKAQKGLYSAWSLRETPPQARAKFFTEVGKDFRVVSEIRNMVSFEQRNFSKAQQDLWKPDSFDVIFFRNVMMYFTPETALALVKRMEAALAPQAYLFLGYAETLRGLSQNFHLCHSHGTFYYQRMEKEGMAAEPLEAWETGRAPSWGTAPRELWQPEVSWVEAIQKASDKIAGLAAQADGMAGKPPKLEHATAAAPEANPWNLDMAMDLMRRERFSEALTLLRSLPPESGADADVMLMTALLLTNLGSVDQAELACRKLLAADELNAGAHYIMALCREYAGDFSGAEEQDRTAVYLDPSFAMPWLHLGILARRRGHVPEARRLMEQALSLLAREDISRVLFFGGGFGREGLLQFCRNNLRSLELAS